MLATSLPLAAGAVGCHVQCCHCRLVGGCGASLRQHCFKCWLMSSALPDMHSGVGLHLNGGRWAGGASPPSCCRRQPRMTMHVAELHHARTAQHLQNQKPTTPTSTAPWTRWCRTPTKCCLTVGALEAVHVLKILIADLLHAGWTRGCWTLTKCCQTVGAGALHAPPAKLSLVLPPSCVECMQSTPCLFHF